MLLIDIAVFVFFAYKAFLGTGWIEIGLSTFFVLLSLTAITYEVQKMKKERK